MPGRIAHAGLARKVVPAEEAAALIRPGATVGMSGFTGAGYPKHVPDALARRIADAHAKGDEFRIDLWTGASTAPELDGALAAADGIELRLPYQSDPVSREKINSGAMEYIDVHLSHVAQLVWAGLPRPPRPRAGRGQRHHRRRRAHPVVVGRQQQDLAGPGRRGDPRGQLVAEPRA